MVVSTLLATLNDTWLDSTCNVIDYFAAPMIYPPRSSAARTGRIVSSWKKPSAMTIPLWHYHR